MLYSLLNGNWHFRGMCPLHPQGWRMSQTRNQSEAGSKQSFMLVSSFVYSSTPKMKATCSSEMSVDIEQTTWCYIPEDRTLQKERCLGQDRMSFKYLLHYKNCTCWTILINLSFVSFIHCDYEASNINRACIVDTLFSNFKWQEVLLKFSLCGYIFNFFS
jgi:hypothetical protein